MGEIREIVEMPAVERWFALLAVAGPLLGVSLGAGLGARKGTLRSGALSGLWIGLLGTLNWGLWRLYNALTDMNGLDTVRNVLVNAVVFVAIGAGIGLVAGRWKSGAATSPMDDASACADRQGETGTTERTEET